VILKSGSTFDGYFHPCIGHEELAKELKYHFIPWKSSQAFRDEHQKTNVSNPVHAVIIDCNNLKSIELQKGALLSR
jgi:hypothetical protein